MVATGQARHPTGAAVALQEMVATLELLSPQSQGQPLQGGKQEFASKLSRSTYADGRWVLDQPAFIPIKINNKLRAIEAAALRTS